MIKRVLNSVWTVLAAIGEAKHARYQQRSFYRDY